MCFPFDNPKACSSQGHLPFWPILALPNFPTKPKSLNLKLEPKFKQTPKPWSSGDKAAQVIELVCAQQKPAKVPSEPPAFPLAGTVLPLMGTTRLDGD